MNSLHASLPSDTDAHRPNPNLDSTQTTSSTTNVKLAREAAKASPRMHIKTPLIYSEVLSVKTGHNIYLKLDALQPSGSFKIRGVGRMCQLAVEQYGSAAHLVTSSGGNAGLAAATAANSLGVKCTVYVPESVEESVKATLRSLKAEVVVAGSVWDTCDQAARSLVDKEEGAIYIHPFEGDDLVEGHASIAHELYEQFPEVSHGRQSQTAQPDMIVCVVGGGGLLNGILRGLSQIRQANPSTFVPPKVVSAQDFGADSFSQSMKAYYQDPITNATYISTLPDITSLARSMGAKTCSASTLKNAKLYAKHGTVLSPSTENGITNSTASPDHSLFSTLVIDDALSGSATWQFKRDHGLMVEIACGAALVPAYQSDRILKPLLSTLPRKALGDERFNVVLIACGGSKIDQDMLDNYETDYGSMEGGRGEIEIGGVRLH